MFRASKYCSTWVGSSWRTSPASFDAQERKSRNGTNWGTNWNESDELERIGPPDQRSVTKITFLMPRRRHKKNWHPLHHWSRPRQDAGLLRGHRGSPARTQPISTCEGTQIISYKDMTLQSYPKIRALSHPHEDEDAPKVPRRRPRLPL